MRNKGKKKFVIITLAVYCLGLLLQQFSVFFETLAKEKNVPHVNIVAVLVDNTIYPQIKGDLERYTTQYIQTTIDESKALVIPLDLKTVDVLQIYRMLENVYFEGLEGVNSTLDGLILVGNIPLPVVNQNGYIFPTIYPYVDFLAQKYVRDDVSQYFVSNWNANADAEVWHWLINFENDIEAYHKFFEKIKKYKADPSGFIWDDIWYEDFIASKNWYLEDNLQFYQNKMLFAEDLDYQRYNPLMLKIFQASQNEKIVGMMEDLATSVKDLWWGDIPTDTSWVTQSLEWTLQTKSVEQMTKKSFLVDFPSLFNQMIWVVRRDNTMAGGRRVKTTTGTDWNAITVARADTSSTMINMKDVINGWSVNIQGVLTNFNSLLEGAVDKKIEKERYDMDIVVPVSYTYKERLWQLVDYWVYSYYKYADFVDKYENFYFGKSADLIGKAQELSMYRWTFQNLHTLSGVVDPTKISTKSIGASYDVFSTQVEANRGYNLKNSSSEYGFYEKNKWPAQYELKCGKWLINFSWLKVMCLQWWREPKWIDEDDHSKWYIPETLQQFAERKRGWASPINLDFTGVQNWVYNLLSFSGFNAIKEIYDIGWSKAISSAEVYANSYKAYARYSSPTAIQTILRTGTNSSTRPFGPYQMPALDATTHIPFEDLNFFTDHTGLNNYSMNFWATWNWKKNVEWDQFSLVQQDMALRNRIENDEKCTVESYDRKNQKNRDNCGFYKEYKYKVIPSIVKNTKIELDELNGYNTTLFATGGDIYSYFQKLVESILSVENVLDAGNRDWLPSEVASYWEKAFTWLNEIWSIIDEIEKDLEKADWTGNYNRKLANDLDKIQEILSNNLLNVKKMKESADISPNISVIMNALNIIAKTEEERLSNWWKIPFATGRYDAVMAHLDKIEEEYQTNVNVAYKAEYQKINNLLDGFRGNIQAILDDIEWNNQRSGFVKRSDITTENFNKIKKLIEQSSDPKNFTRSDSRIFSDFFHVVETETEWVLKKIVENQYSNVKWTQWVKSKFIEIFEKKPDEPLKIEGLNMLTIDRPIDSPRYVTFQSVGETEIKFIYPDLYKVVVYKTSGDNLVLKSIPEIKQALTIYLQGKVLEYNNSLKAVQPSIRYTKQYQTLANLWFKYAIPHAYQSFFSYDDLLKALWWEEQLDVIAELLYYQSITNEERPYSTNVLEDLNFIKQSFNVNSKVWYVMSEYLIEWNNKSKLVLPNYKSGGYEVAYINSDGNDFLQNADVPDFVGVALNQQAKYDNQTKKADLEWIEKDLSDVCNIPENGAVMLFDTSGSPWWDAFQCWLKWTGTIDDPLKPWVLASPFFAFSFNTKEARGPRLWGLDYGNLSWQWLWNALLDYINEESNIDAWIWKAIGFGDDVKQFWNEVQKIINKQAEIDVKTEETIKKDPALFKIYGDIKVVINQNYLSDYQTWILLSIESVKDNWVLDFEVSLTGDVCLNAGISDSHSNMKHNFCLAPYRFSGNMKDRGKLFLIGNADGKAGDWLLIVKICLPSDSTKCVQKTHKITVQPWKVDHFEWTSQSPSSVRWMLTPISITAFDAKDNQVDWTTEQYNIEVDIWQLLHDGSYQKFFGVNRFKNLNFYFQAPISGNQDNAVIKVDSQIPADESLGNQLKNTTYVQNIVSGKPVISINRKQVLAGLWATGEVTIKLDNQMLTGSRQSLILQMHDENWWLIKVNSEVRLRSTNSVANIGNVSSGNFKRQSYFNMKDGLLSATLELTKKSWQEIIAVEIPGLEPLMIYLNVLPAPAFRVEAVFDSEDLKVWNTMNGKIILYDNWWNLVSDPTLITIQTTENIQTSLWASMMVAGQKEFVLEWIKAWNGYIMWKIATNENARPTVSKITVYDALLPQTGLNVMYLNYFGTDWGNQWWYFSDKNKEVQKLIINSNKLLASTTQLVDESKIKQMVWGVSPNFYVQNTNDIPTLIQIQNKNISLAIWEIATLQSQLSNLIWMEVENEREAISTIEAGKVWATNIAFYMLESGETLPDIVQAELTSFNALWHYQVWNLVNADWSYGRVIFWLPNVSITQKNVLINDPKYQVASVFSNGSTASQSTIWIMEKETSLSIQADYLSIQNSDVRDNYVGFRGDFKNMTLFAEWETVGEASRKFGSELLINVWDPVLQKRDKNPDLYGTDYDWWLWQEIFSDSTKTILKTALIDFNSDWLKDLVVMYTDWTVKLSKNYWGSQPYQDLENLLFISVSVEDLFAGDVDGNWYEDLIIKTQGWQMRVYLNNQWKFEIDGRVVCLNINAKLWTQNLYPDDLSNVHQIFWEDMDRDWIIDVITNDNMWFVKIFYGGKTGWEPNYLSLDETKCDAGRYDRQKDATLIVTRFALSLSETKIVDNSMATWKWLNDDPRISVQWNYGKENKENLELDSAIKVVESMDVKDEKSRNTIQDLIRETLIWGFNADEWVDEVLNMEKFFNLETTSLDSTKTGNNYWIPISFLDAEFQEYTGNGKSFRARDAVSVYKIYKDVNWWVLESGDVVEISVTIHANDTFVWAFGDKIQWPRRLEMTHDWHPRSVVDNLKLYTTNPQNLRIYQWSQNFTYILDDIALSAGKELTYTYQVIYADSPIQYISLEDVDWKDYEIDEKADGYLDVKVQSEDWCIHQMAVWFNSVERDHRSYYAKSIDLQSMIDEETKRVDDESKARTDDFMNWLDTMDALEAVVNEQPNLRQILGDAFMNWEYMDFKLDFFEEELSKVENFLSEASAGLCNWFSFWGENSCKGLPIPFNQAFLAPWNYHIMGCYDIEPLNELLWWGLPVFHFPGTLQTPVWPAPFPWGQKWPWDDFTWLKGWIYPSIFRIYIAPTLTAKLGIAMCVWPYSAGINIPSPAWDLLWNCLVTSIELPCWKTTQNPQETVKTWVKDLWNTACNQTPKWSVLQKLNYQPTPVKMGFWSQFSTPNRGDSYGLDTPDINFGPFNLEIDAETYSNYEWNPASSSSFIEINWIKIEADKTQSNNPKSGLGFGSWIRQLLIDNWLDPQIRYIANNLTKMHFIIKRPDLASLIKGASNITDAYKNMDIVDEITDSESLFTSQGLETIKNDLSMMTKIDKTDQRQSWLNQALAYTNNRILTNPFEEIAGLFNSTNLINVSTKNLNVKVPMIFAEDINSYELYLLQWLETNTQTFNEWRKIFDALTAICLWKTDKQCTQDQQEKINEMVKISQDYEKTLQRVHENIEILQRYRLFPFKLYERVHALDTYMAEISSILRNLFGYISLRLDKNANRYASYIDTVILALNIIKTYQVLIDFSVNWSEKCGTCTNDTYDQYMCKLSGFCNFELPLIEIPAFKLPNLILDISDVNIQFDAILPTFNLQPDRIDLPDLPNIPSPPSVVVNIQLPKIPEIPLLPEPPELPDLPSFIPNVELEMPVLPPAPQLPKIPDKIEWSLKLLETIGSIYCWIKNGFWLVAEQAVKAKIEQMTQRTYAVPWMDDLLNFFNVKSKPVTLRGFDYEVSTSLDVKFDFNGIYNYAETLTDKINKSINESDWNMSNLNEKFDEFEQKNKELEDKTQNDLDNPGGAFALNDELEYTDYSWAKARFDEVIAFFKSKAENKTEVQLRLDSLSRDVEETVKVQPSFERINEIQTSISNLIDEEKQDIKQQIWDFVLASSGNIRENYESLLARLDTRWDMSNETKNLAFDFSLFEVDERTKNKVVTSENPYKMMLDNRVNIVSWFMNALNTNSAEDLWMDRLTYNSSKTYFSDLQGQLAGFYQYLTPNQQITLTPKIAMNAEPVNNERKTLVVAWNNIWWVGQSSSTTLNVNEYTKWVWVKNKSWSLTNALYSAYNTQKVQNTYFVADINQDKSDDVIMRDLHNVYVKYGKQNADFMPMGTVYSKYYSVSALSSILNEPQWIEFDGETRLKISDYYEEVKNFKVNGQRFDNLSFSWRKSVEKNVVWYLIKLTDRIDYSYEKEDKNKKLIESWILLLPQWTNLTDLKLKFPYLDIVRNVVDEVQDWQTPERKDNTKDRLINQVIYFDNTLPDITAVLSNIDRKWLYAELATLRNDNWTLSQSSPWSNQVVAGRQIFGDDVWPVGEASLFRWSTQKTVSQGDQLEWFVWTRYDLIVKRNDNVEIAKLEAYQNDKLIKSRETQLEADQISISDLFFTWVQNLQYHFVATDHAGNQTEKDVQLSISIPDIEIIAVDKTSETTVSITAELSQDIDQWDVSFLKNRNGNWQVLATNEWVENFKVEKEKVTIQGKEYEISEKIWLYDKSWTKIATVDPETGEIEIQDSYKWKVSFQAQLDGGNLTIYVVDEKWNMLFNISPIHQQLVGISAVAYEVLDLEDSDDQLYGIYNWWKAIYRNGEIILMVSPQGYLYSFKALIWSYEYDKETKTIIYKFKENQLSNDEIQIRVLVQPF